MTACADPLCPNEFKAHYWGSVKAHGAGWFIQKDGTAWCPDHTPEWVAAWRARKEKTS
jgi:hypothetical protein